MVWTMAWRLFGAEPLSKPILGYCQLDPQEQTLVEFNKKQNFSFTNMLVKMSSAKWRPFCSGGNGVGGWGGGVGWGWGGDELTTT